MTQIETISNGTKKLHIEPIGTGGVRREHLPLLIAAAYTHAARAEKPRPAEPTPEEMLAIGIAIGMQEANRLPPAPRSSRWRLAARLGL